MQKCRSAQSFYNHFQIRRSLLKSHFAPTDRGHGHIEMLQKLHCDYGRIIGQCVMNF